MRRRNIEKIEDEENGTINEVDENECSLHNDNNKCDIYNSYILSGLFFLMFLGVVTIFVIIFSKIVYYITLPSVEAIEEGFHKNELVNYNENVILEYDYNHNNTETSIYNILNEEYIDMIYDAKDKVKRYFLREN